MGLYYTDNELKEIKKYLNNDPSILLAKERTKGLLCDLISDKDTAEFFATVFDLGIINQMRKSNYSKDHLVVFVHNKHYELESVKIAIDFWDTVIDNALLKKYDFAENIYIAENKSERPEKVFIVVHKLYEAAKTYDEYKKVGALFDMLAGFGDSAICAAECKKICDAMDACKKSKELLLNGEKQCDCQDWENCIITYEKIIATLSPFSDFEEAPNIIAQAKDLLQKCKDKYKEQKEYETLYAQAEDIVLKATTISEYKKAGELYTKVSQYSDANAAKCKCGKVTVKSFKFSDAKEKYEFCVGRIKEITIEQQYQTILQKKEIAIKENDLKKRSHLLQDITKTFEQYALSEKASAAVTEVKKLLADCLAEIENQRIKSRFIEATDRFDKATVITSFKDRLDAFSAIVSEFNSDAKTSEFSELIKKCNKEIETAKKELEYESATKLMNSATTEWDFTKSADAFAKLTGFKDSAEKLEQCKMAAKRCKYDRAVADIENNKRFFNFFGIKRRKS